MDLVPNGSIIYFPIGTYGFASGITISKDVTFMGENQELQSTNVAFNRQHDPISILKYTGTSDNVTMFTKASDVTHDVNFVNLVFDGCESYMTDINPDENDSSVILNEVTLPYPWVVVSSEPKTNINALDLSVGAPGIVKNCQFWGFSGYGVQVTQNKYIENCGFFNCEVGIIANFSDNMVHNCWFRRNGTAIKLSSRTDLTNHFASINVSDVWADQLLNHFIESEYDNNSVTITSVNVITDNIWLDSIQESAFCFPNALVSSSSMHGHLGRVGMNYAGVADADRDSTVAMGADVLYCKYIRYSNIDFEIDLVPARCKKNNRDCFSRLITATLPSSDSNDNNYNKIVCNKFPLSKLYDINTTPKGFVNTDYNGTEMNISFHADTMPTAEVNYLGKIIQYTGNTTASYTHGYFYECVSNGATPAVYSWVRTNIQPSSSIVRVNTLPVASASYVGQLVMYMGANDVMLGLGHGAVYECVSDDAPTPTYSWKIVLLPLETLQYVLTNSSDFTAFKNLLLSL